MFHRDVKLSNILLTSEGGRLVAKLSDFGLHVVSARVKGLEQGLREEAGGPGCGVWAWHA